MRRVRRERVSVNLLAIDAVLGFTLEEIAERRGVSRTEVWRRLDRLGEDLPRRRKVVLKPDQIQTIEECVEDGTFTTAEIARLAGVSKQTAKRWRDFLETPPGGPYRCAVCRNVVERRPCPACAARRRRSLE